MADPPGRPCPDRDLFLLLPKPEKPRGLGGKAGPAAHARGELLHRRPLPTGEDDSPQAPRHCGGAAWRGPAASARQAPPGKRMNDLLQK